MEDISSIKKTLKKWETSFFFVHERKPSKEDMQNAPQTIQDAYKQYAVLRKKPVNVSQTTDKQTGEVTKPGSDDSGGDVEKLQTDENTNISVWGKELNKAYQKQIVDPKDGTKKKAESSLMLKMGQKLWAKSNVNSQTKPSNWGVKSTSLQAPSKPLPGDCPPFSPPPDDDSFPPLSQNMSNGDKTVKKSMFSPKLIKINSFGTKKAKTSFLDSDPISPMISLQNRKISRKTSLDLKFVDKFCAEDTVVYPEVELGKQQVQPKDSLSPNRTAIVEKNRIKPQFQCDEIKTQKNCDRKNDTDKEMSTLGFSGIFPSNNSENSENCDKTVKLIASVKKRKHSDDQPDEHSKDIVAPPTKKKRVAHRPNFGSEIDRPESPSTHYEVGWGNDNNQDNSELMIDLEAPSLAASEDETSPGTVTKSKTTKPSRKTMGGLKKGSNENFVRLNMKTKGYRRKGGGMTGPQQKRFQWKQKMASRAASYGDKCFKCGESGHWANKCRGKKSGGTFGGEGPKEVFEEEFPSMKEAGQMARGIKVNKSKKVPTGDDSPPEVSAETVENDSEEEEIEVVRTAYVPPPPPLSMEPYYQLEDDGSLPATPSEVYKALKLFGYDSFRPGQERAVMRILCGQSTLVVLSTGAGKSLCYQLPAVIHANRGHCITLVISPLVSLMEDQVTGLAAGIKGACLHTNMTKVQRSKVMTEVVEGRVHFLLISPEALVGGGASGCLPKMADMPPIAFACIDEAHCVSEWSHHFRPSYLRICKVLRETYGVKCMLGLTATATMVTAASVAQHLGISDYQSATIRDTPVPSNLLLSVSRDEDRDESLIALLQGERFSCCDSIIIYCTRREQTDRIATFIRTCLKDVKTPSIVTAAAAEEKMKGGKTKAKARKKTGKPLPEPGSWSAECYHAGMSAAQRRRVQNAFMGGRLRVVVATVAFGMGIDKPDIRGVIHYTLPKSFESYVQEIGRAGRDGKPAHCHVFLDPRGQDMTEIKKHTYANTIDRVTIKKLARQVFPPCRCRELKEKQGRAAKECGFEDDGVDYGQIDTSTTVEDHKSYDAEKTQPSQINDEENSVPNLDNDFTPNSARTDSPSTPKAICHPSDSGISSPKNGTSHHPSAANNGITTSPMSTMSCRQARLCPGHERAIPIEGTVQKLDIKEEGIATLLCYLELHPSRWLENLTNVYATCHIQCYGGPAQLQAVAKKCPPVAVAIAKERKRGTSFAKKNSLEFNVIEISDWMGWDSGPVKRELKLLQWNFDPSGMSGPNKSGVMVELSELAFHLRSPGDLTDQEMDDVVTFLSERVETQERTELYQLQNFYDTLHGVSHKTVWMCADSVDTKRSDKLKAKLYEYFEAQPQVKNGVVTMLSFARELDTMEGSWLDQKTTCEHEDYVRSNVRAFIHLYGEEHSLTGRSIARVLHGISSPCFPAEVWGRVRRFWRVHMDIDFNVLRRIATQELIRCK